MAMTEPRVDSACSPVRRHRFAAVAAFPRNLSQAIALAARRKHLAAADGVAGRRSDVVCRSGGDCQRRTSLRHRRAVACRRRRASTIVLEPFGRNTAPAVAVAALLAGEADPDAVILAMPVDHWVRDHAAFRAAISTGVTAAGTVGSSCLGCGPWPRRPGSATFGWATNWKSTPIFAASPASLKSRIR